VELLLLFFLLLLMLHIKNAQQWKFYVLCDKRCELVQMAQMSNMARIAQMSEACEQQHIKLGGKCVSVNTKRGRKALNLLMDLTMKEHVKVPRHVYPRDITGRRKIYHAKTRRWLFADGRTAHRVEKGKKKSTKSSRVKQHVSSKTDSPDIPSGSSPSDPEHKEQRFDGDGYRMRLGVALRVEQLDLDFGDASNALSKVDAFAKKNKRAWFACVEYPRNKETIFLAFGYRQHNGALVRDLVMSQLPPDPLSLFAF
jgi:hypothetical protein